MFSPFEIIMLNKIARFWGFPTLKTSNSLKKRVVGNGNLKLGSERNKERERERRETKMKVKQ